MKNTLRRTNACMFAIQHNRRENAARYRSSWFGEGVQTLFYVVLLLQKRW